MDVVLALLLGEKLKGGGLGEGGSNIPPGGRVSDLFFGVLGSFFRFVFRACFGSVLLGAFSTFGWLWVVVWETF